MAGENFSEIKYSRCKGSSWKRKQGTPCPAIAIIRTWAIVDIERNLAAIATLETLTKTSYASRSRERTRILKHNMIART